MSQSHSSSSVSGSLVLIGDVTGSTANNTVTAIQNNPVKSGLNGSAQDGYVLTWVNSASQFQVKPTSTEVVNMAGAVGGTTAASTISLTSNANITGTLPVANQVAQPITGITGDASFTGTTASGAITLDTVNSNVGSFGSTLLVPIVTVNAKGLITAVSTATLPTSYPPNGSAGGDLAGTYPNPTLNKIDGYSLPSPVPGVLQEVSGSLGWGSVNLASSTYVSGVLPTGNQAAQPITGITGDASFTGTTASGTATLATVNSNTGSFGSSTTIPIFTVNGKGLITAVSTASVVSGINQLTGDALAGPGTGSQALTLATVNSNTGSWGSATQVATFTVNAKGLITAASNTTISGVAPGGSAGGDLGGTYPNPTISAIDGYTLPSPGSPNSGVLQSSGTALTWGAVGTTNITPGTSAQILMSNGTPATTWTSLSGDSTISATGSMTNTKIQGNPVSSTSLGSVNDGYVAQWNNSNNQIQFNKVSGDLTLSNTGLATVVGLDGYGLATPFNLGASQDGYVLTYVNSTSKWTPKAAGGGGGSVTWSNDLSGNSTSTSTNQYVSSLSYSSASAGGTIAINGTGTILQWAAGNTAPTINQAAQTSNIATVNTTISPQGGYSSATTNNFKFPGNVVVNFPAVTNGGSWGTNPTTMQGNLVLENNGSIIGGLGIAASGYASGTMGLWFGANAAGANSSSNPVIYYDNSTRLVINSPTSNSIQFGWGALSSVNGNIYFDSSRAFFTGSSFTVGSSVGGGHFFTATGANASTFGVSGNSISFGTGYQSQCGIFYQNQVTKTANYTLQHSSGNNDYIVFVNASGAVTMTLPSGANTGETYLIKDSSGAALTNNITVSGNGKNIEGSSTFAINVNYGGIEVCYNGTQWLIIRSVGLV